MCCFQPSRELNANFIALRLSKERLNPRNISLHFNITQVLVIPYFLYIILHTSKRGHWLTYDVPVNKPRLSLTAPSTSTYDKNQIPDNESANYERMLHYRTLYITGLSQSQLHASLLATLPSIHFISERPRVHLPSIKQHIQKASIEKNYLIHNPKKPYTFSIRKKYLANGRCHF